MRAESKGSLSRWLLTLTLLLGVVSAGLLLPLYWVFVLSSVAIGALIARGVGVVTMQTGLLLLSPLSFAAIGGWLVSLVAADAPQLPFALLLLLAACVTALLGALLGLATARIRGIEFAVLTLGFAAAVDLVFRQGSFAGVSAGTPLIAAAPFDDARWFVCLTWFVLCLAHVFIVWFSNTRMGLSWQMLRVSERAAASVGVNVTASKAVAVAVAAAFSGIAGGLFAAHYGLLTPQMFSVLNSLVVVATAVLAGASLLSGAVLAGSMAVLMPELLRRVGLPLDLGNALFAIGAIDVLRRGRGGIAEQLHHRWVERRLKGERFSADMSGSSAAQTATQTLENREAVATQETHSRPVLQISHLYVQVSGLQLLHDVTLTLEPGHVHALLGANGAGKTTLIDAVTGFVPVTSGNIQLGTKQLGGLSPAHRASLGVRRTFQTSRLAGNLTIGQYLKLAGGAGASVDEAAGAAHSYFGLPHPRVPIRLTDAATQKLIELAGALAARPKVLLLDEPTAGFTQLDREELSVKLAQLPALFNCALLLVEHDLRLVHSIATHVTVLDQGRIIASGAAQKVLAEPSVHKALLGN